MSPPIGKRGAAARSAGQRKTHKGVAPTPSVRRASADSADPAEVHERIWSAIMDHSLPPETRLVEERLCEIFGLGRTRLRQVLQRLAHENVVTLMPNRGAMVAKPSIREAREVFGARRVLEAGTVTGFLDAASRDDLKRVNAHLAREKAAWRDNDRRTALKLSGEFHLVVAEGAGNRILVDLLRDLISRSSLIIAVYQTPNTPTCPPDEHERLVTALEKGDRRAIDLMVKHLDHVLADLRLQDPEDKSVDLESVLASPGRREP
jgi:DNA-binding GntR family transcriptional regulator